MRKIWLVSLILICIFSGCNKRNKTSDIKTENDTVDSSETISENSSEKNPFLYQLNTLYRLKNEWELEDGSYVGRHGQIIEFEDYGYAISDLDNDDLFEIIVSGWEGTGHYSCSKIYEYVDESNITLWDLSNYTDERSEPDLLLQNEISNIYDYEDEYLKKYTNKEGASLFLLTDKEFWGADGGKIYYYIVNVDGNSLSKELLGIKVEETEKKPIYYDSKSEIVEEDEFEKILEEPFVGYKESTTSLYWFTDVTIDELEKSYNAYSY